MLLVCVGIAEKYCVLTLVQTVEIFYHTVKCHNTTNESLCLQTVCEIVFELNANSWWNVGIRPIWYFLNGLFYSVSSFLLLKYLFINMVENIVLTEKNCNCYCLCKGYIETYSLEVHPKDMS